MKTSKIPNVLFDDLAPAQRETLLTAATKASQPISPFSGQPMVYAHCRDTPVFIDQSKRVVVPVMRQR